MAYVVAKPGGRFEIRQAHATRAGPRSRTLATFRCLDDDVLTRAASKADPPVDPAELVRLARRLGVPVLVGISAADRAARQLIAECAAGRFPSPGLAAMVADAVHAAPDMPDSVIAVSPWIAATPAERGRALRDLLLLVDRLPPARRDRPRFPRLVSRR
jgi:hypothetical protein